jgi:hypothetical protein
VCAFGEESAVQLAGTTAHELAHCLAGRDAGHGREWKVACRTLGLVRASASCQVYGGEDFARKVWTELLLLPDPTDGSPVHRVILGPQPAKVIAKPGPCPLGNGTKGGKSRGPGSGSRLRLFMCQCPEKPYRARVACDVFDVNCNRCGSLFERVVASERRRNKASLLNS